MNIQEYQEYIKTKRSGFFESPFDLVYKVFIEQGLDKKDPQFFLDHASDIVESLRENCWNYYVPIEKQFTSSMLASLIDEKEVSELSAKDAIIWFAETYPDHIYQLSLSNTQSRRSRAGKEFEAIIEMIMIGADIALDSQGNIGKKTFVEKGLGKLVDVVSPGVAEFTIDKNDVVLISAKTTLRERWQEVPEEMGRTGAKEMFLATLDDSISDEVLNTLYESNIRITTTRSIKERCYPNNKRVLDFERLLEICKRNCQQWHPHDYSIEVLDQIHNNYILQIMKHEDHDYIAKKYQNRIESLFGNKNG